MTDLFWQWALAVMQWALAIAIWAVALRAHRDRRAQTIPAPPTRVAATVDRDQLLRELDRICHEDPARWVELGEQAAVEQWRREHWTEPARDTLKLERFDGYARASAAMARAGWTPRAVEIAGDDPAINTYRWPGLKPPCCCGWPLLRCPEHDPVTASTPDCGVCPWVLVSRLSGPNHWVRGASVEDCSVHGTYSMRGLS